MRRKVFLRLEVLSLFLWWLALMAVLWGRLCGSTGIAISPAKLLALPTVFTILFGRLERREKERLEQSVEPQGETWREEQYETSGEKLESLSCLHRVLIVH